MRWLKIVHYFLVDYNNDGYMYRFAIEGELEEVKNFLYSRSNHVVYIKSELEPHRKERGGRKIGNFIIRSCRFMFDKISTFNHARIKSMDERHTILEEGEV